MKKSLNNIKNIFIRETKSYLTSPMMYFVIALFFLFANMFFIMSLDSFDQYCKAISVDPIITKLSAMDINSFVLGRQFLNLAFTCVFFLPVLTMRLIADEKKNRTIELLMTSPISSLDIVLGKFFALCFIWIIILIITFMYPFSVSQLPLIEIQWGYYMSCFFGLFLFGLFGIAIGLFASSLTDNLLIAAVVGFIITAVLYFLVNIAVISDSPIGQMAFALSSYTHLEDFYKGILDTKNIVYFLLGTGFALFLSERILESQRWR